jgi:signal transduction histidine kinase
MGQTEYSIFVVVATIVLLVFIGGIVTFIVQYRRKKLAYEKEKATINEQHIQELLNTKLEIQKQTMQDVGREIHDNVGQKLTLASIYTNKMAFENQFPEIKERIGEIGNLITESLSDLRGLSRNLTNANTDIDDIKELVENECKRINALKICDTTCYFNTIDFTISNNNKNFLLRIVQEFIQNSLKHAKCSHIRMDFNYSDEGLLAVLKDDGTGFDMNESARKPKRGIGLSNMKKRADIIGASFALSSILNEGTTLHIFIPANKLNSPNHEL